MMRRKSLDSPVT